MLKVWKCSPLLVLVFAACAGQSEDSTRGLSQGESVTTVTAALTDKPKGKAKVHDEKTKKAFASAFKTLASDEAKRAVKEGREAAATTPFEREMLGLHPVVTRISELSQLGNPTDGEEAELAALTEQLGSNPAAIRLAELTRSSPMSCADFEKAATNQWAKAARRIPELAAGINDIRAQCAAGAGVVTGLWSGLANLDWSSRIVLSDEELPRSEEVLQAVALVGGVVLMVAGGVVACLPGGQVIGGMMIAAGVGAFGYGVSGEFWIGGQCENYPDGTVAGCGGAAVESAVDGLTGCIKGVDMCTSSSTCGSQMYCAYGCCEAFGMGLAKQEAGLSSYLVSIAIPAGYAPNQIGVMASRSLKINDRARVMRPDGTGAPVVTSTEGSTLELGADTFTGDVASEGNVTLRDRASINGNLTVTGTIWYNNIGTVSVSGATTQGAAALTMQRPQTRLLWLTTFTDSGLTPVSLEPGQVVTLPPGDYGAVSVKAQAHLVLQPGTYHFDGLSTESGSFLDIPAEQLTNVAVRNFLNLKGTVVQQGAQTLLLTYVSSNGVYVNQAFAGTLIAPYATVNMDVAGAELRGSVWGYSVELHQGGRVRLAGTSVWDLVSSDYYEAVDQSGP